MSRNTRKLELPQNFAQKLLQCQIQYKLNDPPSKQTVKSLIQLYSQGVEYYQSIRSHKYLYFQLKMNEVFTSASTISAINNQSQSEADSPLKKKMKSTHQQQKIHAMQIRQKQQKLFQQVAENVSQTATVSTVKKMINQNDLRQQETTQKVKKQIEEQDQKLKQKLQKRKSRILFSKSFSSAGIMGQADTQDTLFTETVQQNINHKEKGIKIKPIQVNFGSIIKQNSSDQEDNGKNQRSLRRRMSISQDPSKKVRAQTQQALKSTNKD